LQAQLDALSTRAPDAAKEEVDALKQDILQLKKDLKASEARHTELSEALASSTADADATAAVTSDLRAQCSAAEERAQELEREISKAAAKGAELERLLQQEQAQVEAKVQEVREATFLDAKAVYEKELAQKDNEIKKQKHRYEQLVSKQQPKIKRTIRQDDEKSPAAAVKPSSAVAPVPAASTSKASLPLSPRKADPPVDTPKQPPREEDPIAMSDDETAGKDPGKRRSSTRQESSRKKARVSEPNEAGEGAHGSHRSSLMNTQQRLRRREPTSGGGRGFASSSFTPEGDFLCSRTNDFPLHYFRRI
jgi:hypothetical protein